MKTVVRPEINFRTRGMQWCGREMKEIKSEAKRDERNMRSGRLPIFNTPPESSTSLRSLKTHHFPEQLNLGRCKCLGEQVSRVLCSGNVLHSNRAALNFITKPVVAKVQVLHAPMMLCCCDKTGWGVRQHKKRTVFNKRTM